MLTSLVAAEVARFPDPFADKRTSLIIREKICQGLTNLQYDEFVYICQAKRLNPMLKQIYPTIVDEQLFALVGIGGYRSIAKRTGTFLPGKQARTRRDRKLVDQGTPLSRNPGGLISVTSYAKIFAQGEWHEVTGSAKWDEFAPLKDVLVETDRGLMPTGQKYLDKDGFWYIKHEHMLEKCSDAVMLRRGWPDEYAGLWEPAEFDRKGKTITLSPSEMVEQGKVDTRLRALGGPSISVIWSAESDLMSVPVHHFAMKVKEFIDLNREDPVTILDFRDRNKVALNELWAHCERDGLELRDIFNNIYNTYHNRTPFRDRTTLRRASAAF